MKTLFRLAGVRTSHIRAALVTALVAFLWSHHLTAETAHREEPTLVVRAGELSSSFMPDATRTALETFVRDVLRRPEVSIGQPDTRLRGFAAQRLAGGLHVRVFDSLDIMKVSDETLFCFKVDESSPDCRYLGSSNLRSHVSSFGLFSIDEMELSMRAAFRLLEATGVDWSGVTHIKAWQETQSISVRIGHDAMNSRGIEVLFECRPEKRRENKPEKKTDKTLENQPPNWPKERLATLSPVVSCQVATEEPQGEP